MLGGAVYRKCGALQAETSKPAKAVCLLDVLSCSMRGELEAPTTKQFSVPIRLSLRLGRCIHTMALGQDMSIIVAGQGHYWFM